MAKRYLGYGYTNAQGVAKLEYDSEGNALTHSYTGVGAGKIDIVAESGTLQSETYSIWDTIAYFDGTVNNHFTNVTETEVTEGIQLTSSSQNNIFQKNGTQLCIPTDSGFTIEFDSKNSNNCTAYLTKATNTRYKEIGTIPVDSSTFKNIKYEYSNGVVRQYVDNVLTTTTSDVSITDVSNCGFCITDWQSDLSIIIKNFRIYYS